MYFPLSNVYRQLCQCNIISMIDAGLILAALQHAFFTQSGAPPAVQQEQSFAISLLYKAHELKQPP